MARPAQPIDLTGRDLRCTCGEDDCPICSAPAHQPWTPKPGQPSLPPPEVIEANVRWERWQTIRRYLLVLLLSLLGGMIGGMTSALTILYYFN